MKFAKMKTILMVALLVTVSVFSQGCGKKESKTEVVNTVEKEKVEKVEEEVEEVEEVEEEEEYEEEEDDGIYRVGNEAYGFVNVPGEWNVVIQDDTVAQYVDETGLAGLTLSAVPMPEEDMETIIATMQESLEGAGFEIMLGERNFAGADVDVMYAQDEEGNQSGTWMFETEAGTLNMITVSCVDDEDLFDALVTLVETTFDLNE